VLAWFATNLPSINMNRPVLIEVASLMLLASRQRYC
jgi:hypothetical protein